MLHSGNQTTLQSIIAYSHLIYDICKNLLPQPFFYLWYFRIVGSFLYIEREVLLSRGHISGSGSNDHPEKLPTVVYLSSQPETTTVHPVSHRRNRSSRTVPHGPDNLITYRKQGRRYRWGKYSNNIFVTPWLQSSTDWKWPFRWDKWTNKSRRN